MIQRIKLCEEMAHRIVQSYRKECPEGCDPQNTGIALAGVVISLGTAAYGAYSASQQQEEAAAQQGAALKNGTRTFTPQLLGQPNQIDQSRSLLGNIDANFDRLPYAQQLASATNAGDYRELLKYYKKIQPNFMKIQRQVGSNALSFAKGELPDDVISSIGRASAERGIQGGYGFGSQGAKGGALGNLNLRNLGLTSLDLSKYGTNLGQQVNQNAKGLLPNLMSARDSFFSPAQGLQIASINNDWLNRFRTQDVQYINAARAAEVGAQNTINQNVADRQYASALNSAQTTQAIAGQAGSLISQFGQYYANDNQGWGGNSLATGQAGSATYNGTAVPKATLA